MRKSIVFATSMAAAIALGAPAYAQGLNIGVGANVGVGIGIGGGGGEGGAAGGAQLGVGGQAGAFMGGGNAAFDANAYVNAIIALIANTAWQGNEFNGNFAIDGAQAYSVAAWLTAETEARFRSTVQQSWSQIQNLQAAIAANANLSAWLQAQGHSVSSVVAVGVDAEGRLVAYTM
jgi:hypothetical protein